MCGLCLQGGWVLLQNCHLGLEFMDELLDTVTTAEAPHDTFRVWITTEPHNLFSITLLQVTQQLQRDGFKLASSFNVSFSSMNLKNESLKIETTVVKRHFFFSFSPPSSSQMTRHRECAQA